MIYYLLLHNTKEFNPFFKLLNVQYPNKDIKKLILNKLGNKIQAHENIDILITKNPIELAYIISVLQDTIEIKLQLIPNPATTSVRIVKPNDVIIKQISVYDITGQLVSIYENQNDINISHLSSGLHFVKLETESEIIYKSLLKQ